MVALAPHVPQLEWLEMELVWYAWTVALLLGAARIIALIYIPESYSETTI